VGGQTTPQITQKPHRNTERGLGNLFCASVAILWFCGVAVPSAEANVFRGVQKIIAGVLQVPLSTLAGTFSGLPVAGTVLGAVNGTLRGLGLVASGALELAMDGVVVAKTVAPFLLPFAF